MANDCFYCFTSCLWGLVVHCVSFPCLDCISLELYNLSVFASFFALVLIMRLEE